MFPIAKVVEAAVPGPSVQERSYTKHQLVGRADADIVVYIGCESVETR